jgi:hypothetical protein
LLLSEAKPFDGAFPGIFRNPPLFVKVLRWSHPVLRIARESVWSNKIRKKVRKHNKGEGRGIGKGRKMDGRTKKVEGEENEREWNWREKKEVKDE